MVAAKVVALLNLIPSAWSQAVGKCAYVGSLGLQLVEPEPVLQQIHERVRLDVAGKGERLGVADPAAREVQSGIAVAGLL